MSTYSRPIVFVGKEFEDKFEALYFLKDKQFFSDEECEDIKNKINTNYCSLEDCISEKFKQFPSNRMLNYVKGTGYFIGYIVAYYKTEDNMPGFLKDIEVAQQKWKELFKDEGTVCIRVHTS